MKKVIWIVYLVSLLGLGQIPKGHYLDIDPTSDTGYKIKPFIRAGGDLYHYAVLSELPFDNDCGNNEVQKDWIDCSEQNLSSLILDGFPIRPKYSGVVYVYLTVTESLEKSNVYVESYPASEDIVGQVMKIVKGLDVKPAKYGDSVVNARLWTRIEFN